MNWIALPALGLLFLAGCQQRVSPGELGTVVFEAAELPGAGEPYKRPEMHVPAPAPPTTDVLPGDIDDLR